MSQTLDIDQVVRCLGPALEEYRADPVRSRARQIFGSWLVLTSGVLLVGAAILGVTTAGGTLALFLILALCLSAIGLPLGFWLVTKSVRDRRTRFIVFERGIALEHPRNVDCIRWDEIASVRMKARPWGQGTIYTYRLRLKSGREVSVAKHSQMFPGMPHLCDRIQLELTSRQFPAALEAFDEGRDLRFGPISVNRWGVAKDNRLLPWEAIDEVQLYKGSISIYHHPLSSEGTFTRSSDVESDNLQVLTWSDATPDTVPNIFVLLTLIRQVAPRKQPRSVDSAK